MTRQRLRIFPSHDPDPLPVPAAADTAITLRELLPLVAMAQKLHFVWLQDFLDDQVMVTPDLYDVLRAFKACRPSA